MAIFINGKKMACDPCIRGHRSSKCDHAKERLLLEVRKPGRPLSQCPHTTSSCDCTRSLSGQNRVQVALNRKSAKKCPCGSQKSDRPVPSAIPEPPSPTRHTFKVDKSITSSRQPIRKQPDLESYVDRIDHSHVNIVTSHQFRSHHPIAPLQDNGKHSLIVSNTINNFVQPKLYSPISHGGTWRNTNRNLNGNGYINGNEYHSTSTHVKMDSGIGGFSVTTEAPSIPAHALLDAGDSPSAPVANDLSVARYFQSPYMIPVQPHLTQYGYLSPYGTQDNGTPDPLWQQPPTYAPPSASAFPTPIISYQTMPKATNGDITTEDDILHNCSCGDSCNCLGCIVHPHNTRTTAHVQSTMMEQWGALHTDFTIPVPYDKTSTTVSSPENGTVDDVILNAADYQFEEFMFQCEGIKSACRCPEGCQCSGCQTHDGGFCWGEDAQCPCGPDCSCPGCTVHGNAGLKNENAEGEVLAPPRKKSCCQ